MDPQPSRYPVPCRRTMLSSLGVRVFVEPWTLTIRCGCGRVRVASLPELGRIGLRDREERTPEVLQSLRCRPAHLTSQ